MGSVAKSNMRKGFLVYEEMHKYFTIYEEAVIVIDDFAPDISLDMRKILFYFLSVYKKEQCPQYEVYSLSRDGEVYLWPQTQPE